MGSAQPAGADALIGRTLGEFVVRERIGHGGAGAIYRAEQPALGREAVIKVLAGTATARFMREARLAAQIDHPYAAHVYAFGAEPDGTHWIAMELVRGTALDRLLATTGALPLPRLVPLLDRICEVVHTVHEQGIVHRDLKPSNVMVVSRAAKLMPKLLDLGIAKHVEALASDAVGGAPGEPAVGEADVALTRDGARMLGSPAYAAPEQWEDAAAVDRRADVYALGIMTYELVTGRHPFAGATSLLAMARAHARAPIPPVGGDLPPALDAALARATAKRPADRYSTALELAAAVRAAAGLAARAAPAVLDDTLKAALVARAPRPLALAAAALDDVTTERDRHPEQTLWRTTIRLLAVYAIAARTRTGPPAGGDAPRIVELLRALQAGDLPDDDWADLAVLLTRPFADRRDEHPVPELVGMLHPGGAFDPRELLAWQAGALPRLVRAAAFLADYELAVPRGSVVESWTGLRRARRSAPPAIAALPPGAAVLLDRDGAAVLSLDPMIQVAAPTPGAAEELFVLDGCGRRGARLVASPVGFERDDEAVWTWFRALVGGDSRDPDAVVADAPYRGLAAFSRDDAGLFFGRERESQAFVNRLRTQGLIAVVGASGVGKSSFVQAGVLPALPAGWRAIVVRPGERPIAALASRLAEHVGRDLGAELAADPGELGRALVAACRAATDGFVLVIDQFEELFTLCPDADEARRYAAALVAAAESIDAPVRVIVTLRDDFLVRAEQLPPLRDRIGPGIQILATPAADDLRRTLEEPARRAGYTFEDPALVDEMVAAVIDQPGALALLSFTALKLWERRDRHFKRLTTRAYEALGGVGGALAQHAEEIRGGLSPREQGLLREAFRHLVTGDGTRATLSRAELAQVLGGETGLIDKLVTGRLLVTSETGDASGDRIEIIHETLIVNWPRLVAWRQEDAELGRMRDQLRTAARLWRDRGWPRGLIWRGEALADYQHWRRRYPGALTALEEEFARASLADAARGRRIRIGLVVGAFLALAAGLVVLYVANRRTEHQRALAVSARAEADTSARDARERLLDNYEESARVAMVSGDVPRGLVYAIEAMRGGRDNQDLRFLVGFGARKLDRLEHIMRHPTQVWAGVIADDGKRLFTTCADGKLRAWEPGAAAPAFAVDAGPTVEDVFVIDGGRRIVTAADTELDVWDAATGARQLRATYAMQDVGSAVSPDGSVAVVGGNDGKIVGVDLHTGAEWTIGGHTAGLRGAELTPDGRLILGTDDGTITVRPVRGGPVRTIRLGQGLTRMTASPDGAQIAAGAADDSVVVYAAASGRLLARLTGHETAIERLAYSRDGARLASGSQDGTVRVWRADELAIEHALRGHREAVYALGFSPDGRHLATGSQDGTARLWDLGTGIAIGTFAGHTGAVDAVAFSADGAHLTTTSMDGSARVWATRADDLASTWPTRTLTYAARFALDDRAVVACGDGTLDEWDVASGSRTTSIELAAVPAGWVFCKLSATDVTATEVHWGSAEARTYALPGLRPVAIRQAPGPLRSIAQDGAGTIVASTLAGDTRIWNADGSLRGTIAQPGIKARYAAPTPDGETLVSVDDDLAVRFYDRARTLRATLPGFTAWPLDLQISADGRRAIAGGMDAVTRVWDLAGPARLGELVAGAATVSAVASNADASLIATGSWDGTVRIWSGTRYRLLAELHGHTGNRVFTVAFSKDGTQLVSGASSPEIQRWDLRRDERPVAEILRWAACALPFSLAPDGSLVAREICPR